MRYDVVALNGRWGHLFCSDEVWVRAPDYRHVKELPERLTEGAVFPAGWPAWFSRYRAGRAGAKLCPPAALISRTRLACFWPVISSILVPLSFSVFPAGGCFHSVPAADEKAATCSKLSAISAEPAGRIHNSSLCCLIPQPAFLTDGRPALPVIFRGRTGVLPKDLIPRKLIIFC